MHFFVKHMESHSLQYVEKNGMEGGGKKKPQTYVIRPWNRAKVC